MNWDKLYTAAYKHFDCEYLSPDLCAARKINMGAVRKRHEKKDRIGSTISRFRELMESEHPPTTKQEAVCALSPILGYLLWSIFKTLAIKVIEWAWDQMQQDSQLVSG